MNNPDHHTPYNFDEYLIQTEPGKKERAAAWKTAIGLQDVDGLKPSSYLVETARRHIEGDISIDEVKQLINNYYQTKTERLSPDDGTEEADKVSVNITRLLNEKTFSFSPLGFAAVHKRIFDGVLPYAGKFREVNITKNEWVLRGNTVLYSDFRELEATVKYDLEQEKQFNYAHLTQEELVKHFSKFIAGLWQIHPFREGNTRTTAVFAIKYLRMMGFDVDNDLFADKSWYFRNALVRANYRNGKLGIDPTTIYLERFFDNLLFNGNHELKNRFMVINPPEEWVTPDKYPTSTRQVPDKFIPDNPNIVDLILALGEQQLSVKTLLTALRLKNRENFLTLYLIPSLEAGYVRRLYPDSPKHPRQKYLLTPKGLLSLKSLSKQEH